MNQKMERVESKAKVASVSEISDSASWALGPKFLKNQNVTNGFVPGLILKAREMVTALQNQKIEGFVRIKNNIEGMTGQASATTCNRSQRFTG